MRSKSMVEEEVSWKSLALDSAVFQKDGLYRIVTGYRI
jgi:hypothetical protein